MASIRQGVEWSARRRDAFAVTVDHVSGLAGRFVALTAVVAILWCATLARADNSSASLLRAQEALARGAADIDLFGDGRPSLHLERDSSGDIRRASVDVDAAGLTRLRFDLESVPREFTVVSKGATVRRVTSMPESDGSYSVVETDTPADASVPAWRRTYRIDPASPSFVVTTELDVRRDGRFKDGTTRESVIKTLSSQSAALPGGPQPLPMIGASCSDPAQVARIRSALATTIDRGTTCLAAHPYLLALWRLMLLHIEIDCEPATTPPFCAHALDLTNPAAYMGFWFGHKLHIGLQPIVMGTPVPGYSCPTADLAEALFHESMHYVIGPHMQGDGLSDPKDAVYACQRLCFGKPAPADCTLCTLGQSCVTPAAASTASSPGPGACETIPPGSHYGRYSRDLVAPWVGRIGSTMDGGCFIDDAVAPGTPMFLECDGSYGAGAFGFSIEVRKATVHATEASVEGNTIKGISIFHDGREEFEIDHATTPAASGGHARLDTEKVHGECFAASGSDRDAHVIATLNRWMSEVQPATLACEFPRDGTATITESRRVFVDADTVHIGGDRFPWANSGLQASVTADGDAFQFSNLAADRSGIEFAVTGGRLVSVSVLRRDARPAVHCHL